jgi:hypothetical protein
VISETKAGWGIMLCCLDEELIRMSEVGQKETIQTLSSTSHISS